MQHDTKIPASRLTRGWRRLCLVLLTAIAISACTSRIVYDNADWWLNWYIDDYVRFNHKQQHLVDDYLDQHLQWHRQHELPRYEAFLRQVKHDLDGEPDVALVLARFETIYQFWRDFVSKALPSFAAMLGQLDDKQTRDFIASIEKETREFEQDYDDTTAAERLRDQQKDAEKSLKKWLGKLSSEQRQIVSNWAHAMQNVYPASIRQRKQWQSALTLAMHERGNRELFQQRLHTLFVSPSDSWSDEYRSLMNANERVTAQMLVDIQRSLTPKQKERLFATLEGYADDIRKLHRQK